MDYKKQYTHPEWQKKRLQILERDNFTCQTCLNDNEVLHVHHKFYIPNKLIWDYNDEWFITLCGTCHENAHSVFDGVKNVMVSMNFKSLLEIQFLVYKRIQYKEITEEEIIKLLKNG
jgi:hypothetical protein